MNTAPKHKPNWTELPMDLWVEIVSHTNLPTLRNLSETTKAFQNIGQEKFDETHTLKECLQKKFVSKNIIAAGRFHTCALKTNGKVLCWGDNRYNQTTIPEGLRLW